MKQVFPMDSRVTYDAEGRPSYDRAVSSKPLRSLIRKLFTTGVMPNPSNTCQVKAGGDGMTLIVSPGLAVLEGGLYLEDAARTLSVTAADPTFDRIDTVVLRWNENDSVRDCDLHVVAGVPARNPVRPALTREGSIYEIGLADIFVTKGVATITNEKITDTRMESARCGIVSSVSEWDTTTIYQQIQSDLAGFKTNEQAEFMTWFNKMKDQLTEDAAGRLQTEIDDMFDVIRPVGSLYPTTDAKFDPNTAKGWHGTWERIKDCVIYAAGDSDTVGAIVGSNTHALTEAELPSHSHSIPKLSGSTESTGEHSHGITPFAIPVVTQGATYRYVGGSMDGEFGTIPWNTNKDGEHTHSVTTNASTTGANGSGTAIDMRTRRLNSIVWRRVS